MRTRKDISKKGAAENMTKIREQFPILFKRNLRLFLSFKGFDIFRLIILFAGPVVAAYSLCWVMNGHFSTQLSMNICALLIMVMAAVYIGTFNSLLTVCNEKQILKYEFISGVSPAAYILSIASVHLGVCIIQAGLFTTVYLTKIKLPEVPFLMGKGITWLISLFLVLYASDMFGLFLSCLAPNGETANFLSPVCLIAQMLFSGTLWPMDNFLSRSMIARWGMASIGSLIDLGTIDAGLTTALSPEEQIMIEAGLKTTGYTLEDVNRIISDRMISASGLDISIYQPNGQHVLMAWLYLLGIIFVLLFINIFIVRFVKNRKR